jgi:hypothetical protein
MVAVAAPKRSGNISVAPRPKVKAIGALVITDIARRHPKMSFREGVARGKDIAVELDCSPWACRWCRW